MGRPGSLVDGYLKAMNKVLPQVTLREEERPDLLRPGHSVHAWGPSLALRATLRAHGTGAHLPHTGDPEE